MPEVSFNIVSRWARTGQLRLAGKRAVPGRPGRGGAGNPRSAARDRPGARARGEQPKRDPLTADEEQFVRDMVIHRTRTRSCSTSRRGSRRRAGPRPPSISTDCSTGWRTSAGGPSWCTGSTRIRRGRCWWRGRARAAGHFAKAFSGRTARKVYWALVVGDAGRQRGRDRRAARQAAGHRRREDAYQRGTRPSRENPLAGDRPRRQSRRLGRAAAADRPHSPAARAHGVDRPSDRRRREIWRRRRRS